MNPADLAPARSADLSLDRRVELAFLGYAEAHRPAAVPAAAALKCFAENDKRILPRAIFECRELAERAKMPGRGVYDAHLHVHYISQVDDTAAAAHSVAAGALFAVFTDHRAAVRSALNVPRASSGLPDRRPVRAFHAYDYFARRQETVTAENHWVSTLELLVVCQGADLVLP